MRPHGGERFCKGRAGAMRDRRPIPGRKWLLRERKLSAMQPDPARRQRGRALQFSRLDRCNDSPVFARASASVERRGASAIDVRFGQCFPLRTIDRIRRGGSNLSRCRPTVRRISCVCGSNRFGIRTRFACTRVAHHLAMISLDFMNPSNPVRARLTLFELRAMRSLETLIRTLASSD